MATARAAESTHPLGWQWGPGIAAGFSKKSGDTSSSIAPKGYHLGANVTALDYHADWLWDLGLGLQYNRLSGTSGATSVKVETTSAALDLGARYRFSGFQLGPVVRALMGQDVSFAEFTPSTNPAKRSTALLAGVNFLREDLWGDYWWRYGLHALMDLNVPNRNILQVGLNLSMELPFGSGKSKAKPESNALANAYAEPAPQVEPARTRLPQVTVKGKSTVFLTFDDEVVEFATNSHQLDQNAKTVIAETAGFLTRDGSRWRHVRVEGHADKRGSYAYNQNLSFKRAQSVAMEFQRQGVDANLVSIKGFSFSKPIYRGNDEALLRKNRRVEVYVEGVENPNQFQRDLQGWLSERTQR
jgi:outer membrane protein OmpA-like peptidoglycan-associated protein